MALTLDGTKGETFPTWTTAGRPASPNTGQTGYNTSLNALEYYDGTNWKQNYITSGTAQNSTSGTSIDFTGIPAGVKRITVMFNGVSTSGTSIVLVQIGSSSGGVEASGYLGATTYFSASAIATVNGTTGVQLNNGGEAGTNIRQGNIVICNLATNTWTLSGSVHLSDTTRGCFVSYSKGLSSTLDRVRITTVNGTDTFDAGSINIMYE